MPSSRTITHIQSNKPNISSMSTLKQDPERVRCIPDLTLLQGVAYAYIDQQYSNVFDMDHIRFQSIFTFICYTLRNDVPGRCHTWDIDQKNVLRREKRWCLIASQLVSVVNTMVTATAKGCFICYTNHRCFIFVTYITLNSDMIKFLKPGGENCC